MDWSQSGLHPDLTQIMLTEFQFPKMTPVQISTIPHFCGNKDVCVEACTGSGKTLAYLLPIFHKLLTQDYQGIFAIIIVPNRELSIQIHQVALRINEGLADRFKIECFIGGRSLMEDIERATQNVPDIIIGTPGRLSDLLQKQGLLDIRNLGILILDEADRLLDFGYTEKVREIVGILPKQRRTGLFSATMTTQVESLVKAGLRNALYIKVSVKQYINPEGSVVHQIPEGLQNYYTLFNNYQQKLPTLLKWLKDNIDSKTIIFFGTCASTNYYYTLFQQITYTKSFPIFRMNGRMKQNQRERIYNEFQESARGILLTTDLCARGIDIPNIDWIIQYDPPSNPDFFIHRIGRTARAGKVGNTMLYLLNSEDTYIDFLALRKVELTNIPHKQQDEASVYSHIYKKQIKDRELYEKAQAAFVSFVRYYKEHQLNYIFKYKELDIGSLATSFVLLRIPRVTEILGRQIDGFQQSDLDPETIPYKDQKKERERLAQIQQQREKEQQKKSKPVKKELPVKRQRSKLEKRQAKYKDRLKEWEELQSEERLIKKIKKGKANSEEVQEYIKEHGSIKTLFRQKRKRKSKH